MIGLFVKDALFCPNDYRKTVYDIPYEELQISGIKALFVDLDNTLIPYDEDAPNEAILELFKKWRDLSFQVVIISNNHLERVKFFADQVQVPFVYSARKPLKKGFKKAYLMIDSVLPQEICVIGDQFMTDVLGAKRMGYQVIVVDAIKRNVEKWYTRINRKLEKRVLKKLKKHDIAYYTRLNLEKKR